MSAGDRIAYHLKKKPEATERTIADATGLSQATFHRIKTGKREPKMNELIAIAAALGCSLSELTGNSPVADRLLCSARSTSNGAMAQMQAELTHYFELDALLDEQGIAR
jgi:HTH-type transcriptional regulator, cell division transcriptional repressor